MRRTRLIYVGNDFLQVLFVFVVSALLGGAIWYWMWPFGMRMRLAVAAGVAFGIFCAIGSHLRTRDIEWEREHTKALPMTARRRYKERAGSRGAGDAS